MEISPVKYSHYYILYMNNNCISLKIISLELFVGNEFVLKYNDRKLQYTGGPKIRGKTQWGNVNSCYKIMRKII
jgi:hypothetical protein